MSKDPTLANSNLGNWHPDFKTAKEFFQPKDLTNEEVKERTNQERDPEMPCFVCCKFIPVSKFFKKHGYDHDNLRQLSEDEVNDWTRRLKEWNLLQLRPEGKV